MYEVFRNLIDEADPDTRHTPMSQRFASLKSSALQGLNMYGSKMTTADMLTKVTRSLARIYFVVANELVHRKQSNVVSIATGP
jgi:hypothetical protein